MSRDLAPATPESVGLSAAGLQAIDGYLQGLIDEGTLAGVVTLVARHGKTVHTSVMGKKDLASGEPLALDTIFRIFSMTKPVTAVAMSILYDEGRWSLDDPIAKHLPTFAGVGVFDGLDDSGKPKTTSPDHAPTMRELMTHTAGLSYGFNPEDPLDKLYQAKHVWQSDSLAEFAEKVASLPLAYQPGTKWLYSMSMDVQGAIVEKLSGLTLPEFMRTRIFEPLGMVDTAFHTPPEKAARRATLYRWSPRRKLLLEAPNILGTEHERPPKVANGGGGLVSTVIDYARFAQMLLNGGKLDGRRICGAEALKTMMSDHLTPEFVAKGWGVGHQQLRPGFSYAWNGAVFTDPALSGVPVGKGTYHWDGAAGTWFWVDPTNDLIFVGMIQRMGDTGGDPLGSMARTLTYQALLHPER
jgi:CubicO group peptidase (beta-lactamase class C family)